jgi:hypothetical protein
MKTPRLTDFDPDAKVPALKSSLEDMPVIQKPPQKQTNTSPAPLVEETPPPAEPQSPTQQPEHVIPERTNARPPVRSNAKRIITRNSFEIYEDQMDALRRLAYLEKMDGKIGSMSAMVREAIDTYLKEKTQNRE